MTPGRPAERDPERELERDVGAVLLPEVRVAGTLAGADPVRPASEHLRRFPPAGVVVFGRTPEGASSPAELLAAVRAELAAAGAPRCFAACDLEQGAGLHFPDATRLPPARALAARGDAAVRSAAAITALEARERGVELVLAPVADLDTNPASPIVATRSFGEDAARVAALVRAFVEGLHRGGAGGVAKHFPGHGDAAEDSHLELARVARTVGELAAREWAPFRAGLDAGVDAVMVGHLDAPALTGEPGLPCTLSPRAIGALRAELGFSGAVLTDALGMGALSGLESIHARALAAGCDGLLCPTDPARAAQELLDAVERGELARERLREAAARMRALAERLHARRADPPRGRLGGLLAPTRSAEPDPAAFGGAKRRAALARRLAGECLVRSPAPWPWRAGAPCEVLAPVPAGAGPEARASMHELRRELVDPAGGRNALVPVLAEVRAYAGRYGPGAADLAAVEAKRADLARLGWRVALAWFASPATVPQEWWRSERAIVIAFAPTPPMARAVADFLAGRSRPLGSLAGAPH